MLTFSRVIIMNVPVLSILYLIIYHKHVIESIKTPTVIVTWKFQKASETAWNAIYHHSESAIDAIEKGCSICENLQCEGTVGYGGSPDENGETTLDAMLMDGTTMDVGAVAALRNVKRAISVAKKVLKNTAHTLLVGELATSFAEQMGFQKESLQTNDSYRIWQDWRLNKCQPNFWKNVAPDPTTGCGPYRPVTTTKMSKSLSSTSDEHNHDTIGMIAIDSQGSIAAGTSTNGAKNKIPGRVGDSPIPGSGAYADQEVGAAAATGDGDIMMRFLPSFLTVELMRNGLAPSAAAEVAIKRITKYYPKFFGAIVALNRNGQYGAACHGMSEFPFYASNIKLGFPILHKIPCFNN